MKMTNYQAPKLVRKIDLEGLEGERLREALHTQWLVTNGLGGFASATICGVINWRYHGLLIAALPSPLGRIAMLSHLTECLHLDGGREIQFGGVEPAFPSQESPAPQHLVEFRLENQLPFWVYEIGGVVIEKRIWMPYLQNTVHVHYRLVSGAGRVVIELRPSMHFRQFEAPVDLPINRSYEVRGMEGRFEIHSNDVFPPLRLYLHGERSSFTYDGGETREIFYERDAERGYESRGMLWSPGFFKVELTPEKEATLIASTESWNTISALDPESACHTEVHRRDRLLRLAHPQAQSGPAAELVLAADQFIMTPAGRIKDAARARASGDELRSVIAGYHWFTDWGRDTMISLEGLTLTTGRTHEAAWILRTFAHYVKYGLIPNMFPEGQNEGLYHTADATLWFFQALHRYVQSTGDLETLNGILPTLRAIIAAHLKGTKFGIGVDPGDGLLKQGKEGYQLTWMDAKVGDWVVTPRRGKAVEINALWFNALTLMTGWLRNAGDDSAAEDLASHAARAKESFNARFWNPRAGCLFDVVDGEEGSDPAIRPNQILAVSLTHPILEPGKWEPVMQIAKEKLLTPLGLRSLAPGHPDYKSKYFGDLRSRDAAYHQGTVWAWLIGPFIDAWLRVYPHDRRGARAFLDGFAAHLSEGCVGSINEIFDAQEPFTPRGCIAQAWSVAEVLRCYVLTAE